MSRVFTFTLVISFNYKILGDLIAGYNSVDQVQTFCRHGDGREALQALWDTTMPGVCDEHSDLHAIATVWPGLFLSEIRGTQRRDPARDISGRSSLHRPTADRASAGYVFPKNRTLVAGSMRKVN